MKIVNLIAAAFLITTSSISYANIDEHANRMLVDRGGIGYALGDHDCEIFHSFSYQCGLVDRYFGHRYIDPTDTTSFYNHEDYE